MTISHDLVADPSPPARWIGYPSRPSLAGNPPPEGTTCPLRSGTYCVME